MPFYKGTFYYYKNISVLKENNLSTCTCCTSYIGNVTNINRIIWRTGMNMDNITLEDCIDMHYMKDYITVIENGHVVRFKKEGEEEEIASEY